MMRLGKINNHLLKIFIITMITLHTSIIMGEASLSVSDFKIIQTGDDDFYIQKKDLQLKLIKIKVASRFAKIESVNPYEKNPKILLIQYHAGESGTKKIIAEKRVAFFNKETELFLGDAPKEYKVKGEQSPKEEIRQPEWIYSKEGLSVKVNGIEVTKIKL